MENEIVCYAKCWGCQFGQHYDPPAWHGWADGEDLEHAKTMGQDVEAIKLQRCGCECAVIPAPCTEKHQAGYLCPKCGVTKPRQMWMR